MNAVGADQQIGLQGHGFTVGPFEDPRRAILAFETASRWLTATAGGASRCTRASRTRRVSAPARGKFGAPQPREAPPGLFPNLLPMAIKVGEGSSFHPRLKQGLGYPRASRCATPKVTVRYPPPEDS